MKKNGQTTLQEPIQINIDAIKKAINFFILAPPFGEIIIETESWFNAVAISSR